MARVEILVSSAYHEMLSIAHMIWDRQKGDCIARINQAAKTTGDAKRARWNDLALLVETLVPSAEFFMLGDDDDYVHPSYIEHCLDRIGDADTYGEIPGRTYLLRGPAYGERDWRKPMGGRRTLFTTFVLYRRRVAERVVKAMRSDNPVLAMNRIIGHQKSPPHSKRLVIMRGLMNSPAHAITAKKNLDSDIWKNRDPEYKKLREWVDTEMYEYLLMWARMKGWTDGA